MTKQSITNDLTTLTDAKFRAWGAACKAAMAAAGLVQTADTGQINWTTVLKATAANTVQGYEVWRFADSLQATKPIYFKLEYGSGGHTSGLTLRVRITLGTGSDGAGTITGPNTGAIFSGNSSTSASSNASSLAQFAHSTVNGYALLNFGLSTHTAGGSTWETCGWFLIERTKDSAGSPTGNGVGLTHIVYGSSASLKDVAINFDTLTAYPTVRNPHCGSLSSALSLSNGDDIALFKHYTVPGKPYAALGRLSFYSTDIPSGTTFTAAPLGASRTYFAYPAFVGADSAASSTIALAYLWED